MTKRTIGQAITLVIVLYGLWILLSGFFTPFLLTLGLLSTAIAVVVAFRMDLVDQEGVPVIHLTRKFWTYVPYLIKEIVVSNIATAKIVLSPDLPAKPMIFRVRAKQRTDLGRVIFGNSITITPGTITLAIVGETLFVHALDGEAAGDMSENEMNARVAELERPEQ